MARRIVEGDLREAIYAADRKEDERKYGALEIDLPVKLHWASDGNKPHCHILRAGFEGFNWDHVIGAVANQDDLEWLTRATGAAFTARIHELGRYDQETGRKLFKLEVLTGQDHDVLIAERRQREWIAAAGRHWWKIALLLVFLYWWIL